LFDNPLKAVDIENSLSVLIDDGTLEIVGAAAKAKFAPKKNSEILRISKYILTI